MPTCSKCESPVQVFKTKSAKLCKEHLNAYNRDWYRSNRLSTLPKKAVSNRKRRSKIQDFVAEAKSVPCADCGVRYPPYVMDFDHLGDKVFAIAAKKSSVSKEVLLAEIAKCDVVCANCHRERTHRRLSVLADQSVDDGGGNSQKNELDQPSFPGV